LHKLCHSKKPSTPVHSTCQNLSMRGRWLGCQTWEGQPYHAWLQACMVDSCMFELGVPSIPSFCFH
jgi:hypothetical protein